MTDSKYVVFKREEFSKWYQTVDSFGGTVPMALDDAVVIRTQDVFAAPALDAYANSIRIACKVMSDVWEDDGGHGLGDIADYFHERAVEAWERADKKLPD